MKKILILFFCLPQIIIGQVSDEYNTKESDISLLGNTQVLSHRDSLCKYGKKYKMPKYFDFGSVSIKLPDEEKLKLFKEVIPSDTIENEIIYNFLLRNSPILAFELLAGIENYTADTSYRYRNFEDSIPSDTTIRYSIYGFDNKVKYFLKNLHFFDVNNDGILDILYYGYGTSYEWMMSELSASYWLISSDSGYVINAIYGYFTEINFKKKKQLYSINTFLGIEANCCGAEGYIRQFRYYSFDPASNRLIDIEEKKIEIADCQLKKN